jgi:hypothetical protein
MMDGHIVYQGLPLESTLHFAQIGILCPLRSNPADFYMRVLSVNYPKTSEDEEKIKTVVNHYDISNK